MTYRATRIVVRGLAFTAAFEIIIDFRLEFGAAFPAFPLEYVFLFRFDVFFRRKHRFDFIVRR